MASVDSLGTQYKLLLPGTNLNSNYIRQHRIVQGKYRKEGYYNPQ